MLLYLISFRSCLGYSFCLPWSHCARTSTNQSIRMNDHCCFYHRHKQFSLAVVGLSIMTTFTHFNATMFSDEPRIHWALTIHATDHECPITHSPSALLRHESPCSRSRTHCGLLAPVTFMHSISRFAGIWRVTLKGHK